jgi:hypothetical protein
VRTVESPVHNARWFWTMGSNRPRARAVLRSDRLGIRYSAVTIQPGPLNLLIWRMSLASSSAS